MIDLQPDPHEFVHRELKRRAGSLRRFELASECWAEAEPIDGTLAERYLRGRAIRCRLPKSLRYNPAVRPRRRRRMMPALIAQVRNSKKFVGICITFLVEPGLGAFGARSMQTLGKCGGSDEASQAEVDAELEEVAAAAGKLKKALLARLIEFHRLAAELATQAGEITKLREDIAAANKITFKAGRGDLKIKDPVYDLGKRLERRIPDPLRGMLIQGYWPVDGHGPALAALKK